MQQSTGPFSFHILKTKIFRSILIQPIRREMLAFLRLILRFNLADTPYRRNAKHFGGWL